MTPEEADEVRALHRAHVDRLARVDPLVVVGEPPEPSEHQVFWTSRREAVGVAVVEDVEPGSAWLWTTDRSHRLAVRCPVDPTPELLGELLDPWLSVVAADPASSSASSSASVGVVSRDVGAVAALTLRHFAPASVLAVRRRAQAFSGPEPRDLGPVALRPATPGDLEQLVELSQGLHAHEARYGAVPSRPDAAEVHRSGLRDQLAAHPGWTWVAEHHDDGVVGMCAVTPPESAGWVAHAVSASPAAYLATMFVRPGLRGQGVGSELVALAHSQLDASGVEVTLLHFGASNTLSAPFWAAHGYRPLVTVWQRRPAVLP